MSRLIHKSTNRVYKKIWNIDRQCTTLTIIQGIYMFRLKSNQSSGPLYQKYKSKLYTYSLHMEWIISNIGRTYFFIFRDSSTA